MNNAPIIIQEVWKNNHPDIKIDGIVYEFRGTLPPNADIPLFEGAKYFESKDGKSLELYMPKEEKKQGYE